MLPKLNKKLSNSRHTIDCDVSSSHHNVTSEDVTSVPVTIRLPELYVENINIEKYNHPFDYDSNNPSPIDHQYLNMSRNTNSDHFVIKINNYQSDHFEIINENATACNTPMNGSYISKATNEKNLSNVINLNDNTSRAIWYKQYRLLSLKTPQYKFDPNSILMKPSTTQQHISQQQYIKNTKLSYNNMQLLCEQSQNKDPDAQCIFRVTFKPKKQRYLRYYDTIKTPTAVYKSDSLPTDIVKQLSNQQKSPREQVNDQPQSQTTQLIQNILHKKLKKLRRQQKMNYYMEEETAFNNESLKAKRNLPPLKIKKTQPQNDSNIATVDLKFKIKQDVPAAQTTTTPTIKMPPSYNDFYKKNFTQNSNPTATTTSGNKNIPDLSDYDLNLISSDEINDEINKIIKYYPSIHKSRANCKNILPSLKNYILNTNNGSVLNSSLNTENNFTLNNTTLGTIEDSDVNHVSLADFKI